MNNIKDRILEKFFKLFTKDSNVMPFILGKYVLRILIYTCTVINVLHNLSLLIGIGFMLSWSNDSNL